MAKKFYYRKESRKAGFGYLGATKTSAKLMKSYEANWATYGIYLAPATLARDARHPKLNTCPFSANCAEHCLNGSGRNKICLLAIKGKEALSAIDQARIARTHLFYDNREKFMRICVAELEKYRRQAERDGMNFAVRLNCTSDLSPERWTLEGKNILEMYPDIQFYDYTKVPSRLKLAEKYDNYDLTFSYDGTNWDVAEKWLKKGGKVAVVFDIYDENGKQTLPETWRGYKVIDANGYDMRFLDPAGTIMGLHYHRVANDYVKGKYMPKDTPFIVRELEEKKEMKVA